jgi:hypothetical protein
MTRFFQKHFFGLVITSYTINDFLKNFSIIFHKGNNKLVFISSSHNPNIKFSLIIILFYLHFNLGNAWEINLIKIWDNFLQWFSLTNVLYFHKLHPFQKFVFQIFQLLF